MLCPYAEVATTLFGVVIQSLVHQSGGAIDGHPLEALAIIEYPLGKWRTLLRLGCVDILVLWVEHRRGKEIVCASIYPSGQPQGWPCIDGTLNDFFEAMQQSAKAPDAWVN